MQVPTGLHLGASPEEWEHFSKTLGLTEHIYPVVCNPNARPSENSAVKKAGKVPSYYVKNKRLIGVRGWPTKVTLESEIEEWMQEPDYGFCINARELRAFDVDVDNEEISHKILKFLRSKFPKCAIRTRRSSPDADTYHPRFLFPFYVDGTLEYNNILVNRVNSEDKIEFLADGRQFQATGLHTSSFTRYEWLPNSLPETFPTLTQEELRDLWHELAIKFAVAEWEPIVDKRTRNLTEEPAELDRVARYIKTTRYFLSVGDDNSIRMRCPFEHEHTTESSETSTIYMPAGRGYEQGHFKCLHGHCANRDDDEFLKAIDYDMTLFTDTFEEITGASGETITLNEDGEPLTKATNRFAYQSIGAFINRPKAKWIVKHILPKAGLGVLFGASGSGKSFLILDMALSIAKGTPWNGKKVNRGRVVYICAEGVAGLATRLKAYALETNLPDDDYFHIIPSNPNILEKGDCKDLVKSIKHGGACDLIVIDTFAQVIPGANENASEDVGKAIAHCQAIHKATGAMVLLIHHSGKDETRGQRGWSGIKGACDVEIEVKREPTRQFTISKLKDGREGDSTGFQLNEVFLYEDEDGDKVTSCTVELTGPVKTKEIKKISEKDKSEDYYRNLVIEAFVELKATDEKPKFIDILMQVFEYDPPPTPTAKKRAQTKIEKAIEKLKIEGKLKAERGSRFSSDTFGID